MCGPTTETMSVAGKDGKDSVVEFTTAEQRSKTGNLNGKNSKTPAESAEPKPEHRGFLYGTLSIALMVTASSVVMGFYQSKRDTLGCDVQCIGTMTSARSTLTLVGSTIIGKCSDSVALDSVGGARRFFLVLGLLASALDILISFRATSIRTLWIGMVPSALFQQNFTVLKALFIEYHDESASAAERAGRVGKLGMAVGLAFMAGPLMGSVLFQEHRTAGLFAAACLLGSIVCVALLPNPPAHSKTNSDTNTKPKSAAPELARNSSNSNSNDNDNDNSNNNSNPPSKLQFQPPPPSSFRLKLSFNVGGLVPDLVPAARTPAAVFIMVSRLFMGLSFHIFQTIWSVALRERFRFGPKDYGRYYSFIGLLFAVSQGFVAKFLLKRYGATDSGRKRLLLACALVLGGGRFLAYQTHSLGVVYGVFGAIITALGVINTVFTADTSKIASPSELGGLFGVLGSVESLAGITGPIAGGLLSGHVHAVWGPLGAVLALYGSVFVMIAVGYETVVCGSSGSSGGGGGVGAGKKGNATPPTTTHDAADADAAAAKKNV